MKRKAVKRKKTQSPPFLASFKLNRFFWKDGSKSAFLSWNSLKQLQLRTDFFPLCNSPFSLFWTDQILYFWRDFHLYKCRNGWLRSREASKDPQAPRASLLSNMPQNWTLWWDIGKSSIHQTFMRVLQPCSTLIMAPNGGQKWWSSSKKYWDIWRHEPCGKTEREVGLLSLKTCNPKNIEGGLPP